jgi:hypothetical protein
VPADSTPEVEEAVAFTGIAFGSFNMENAYFSGVHTGSVRGGGLTPSNIVSLLADARAKGARIAIKLCNGRDSYVKNSDGTFSLTKWKTLVDRFKAVNLGPYIADGTIVGHYLIDEPQNTKKWGGRAISQATVEAMAKHSKQIWPAMPTLVRVVPSWLAGASLTYTYLDAGWAQYASSKGNAGSWVAAEVAVAKRKGLGLVVGMNVLDGGNGSSGIPGYSSGRYAMSASEIRTAGAALLADSYACGFFMWMHDLSYYGRSDVKSAMADLSARARAHVKTSCRQ